MEASKTFAQLTPEQRVLFGLRLKQERQKAAGRQLIKRHEGTDIYPLSFEQEHLWVLHLLDPDRPVYNLNHTFTLEGTLDVDALERSFGEIARRHETLRTSIVLRDGLPFQSVGAAPELALVDLCALPEREREEHARRLAAEHAWRPFSLTQDRLMRATVVRLSERRYFLLLTLHHIITDWWSFKALYRELSVLYRAFVAGEPSPLTDLPIQYGDYALWQREWLSDERLDKLSAYWKKQLTGAPPLLDLPLDRPRRARQTFRGTRQHFRIPAGISEAIKSFSRHEQTTLFTTLLGVFQTLLHRYSSQKDVLTGTPSANRGRAETEGLIGYLLNMIVLRADFSGQPSFRALLRRLRAVVEGAQSHQDLPLHKVVELLNPGRSSSHTPLYQTNFIFLTSQVPSMESLDSRGPALDLPGLRVGGVEVENVTSWLDLTLVLEERPDGFAGFFEYNTDLFDATTITRMTEHLQQLMSAIAAEPDRPVADLPFLTPQERQGLSHDAGHAPTCRPNEGSLQESFEVQAERTPEAVAVSYEQEQLSYRELNERANQLARHLRASGVGVGAPVAVCVERSIGMVVALLGILKAGGSYLPLDPYNPPERLALIMKDCGVRMLVTQTSVLRNLAEQSLHVVLLDGHAAAISRESRENLPSTTLPEHLAYIIYTSGSTGWPKGVEVSHGSLLNLFAAARPALEFGPGDVWSNFHSYTFDLSVWEIFGALLHGAHLVIIPHEVTQAPAELLELLRRQRVSVLNETPSAMRALMHARDESDRGCEGLHLRLVACGGEPLPRAMVESLKLWGVPVWNLYGPTEAAVWTTIHRLDESETAAETVQIGKPLSGTEIYILDQRLNPVPTNVAGELYIGGEGVARGYHALPATTAASFVPHPFTDRPGERLYRTGDHARRSPAGEIIFLGRVDHQVKVRGFRVELGEVEAAINSHPDVNGAVVSLHEYMPGEKNLVAHFATVEHAELTGSELRRFLHGKLPEYMIPSTLNRLDELPLTSHGKIDRNVMLSPSQSQSRNDYVAPRTQVERVLADIWAEVLGGAQAGIYDNFFELGGHSLSLTQLASRIRARFDVKIPLRVLYHAPTIVDMTVAIAEQQLSQADDDESSMMIEELRHLSPEEVTARLASESQV